MIKITKINQYKHLLQPINKNQLNEVIFKIKDYDRYDTIKLDKFNTPQEALEFILGELNIKNVKYLDIRNSHSNTIIDYGVYNAHYLITNCEIKEQEV